MVLTLKTTTLYEYLKEKKNTFIIRRADEQGPGRDEIGTILKNGENMLTLIWGWIANLPCNWGRRMVD